MPWFLSRSKASMPTLRMVTSTLEKLEPSRMKPLMPLSVRPAPFLCQQP